MALTVSISGYVPPAGVPLTMAALRKLATGFTVSISGTVSGGEVVDGSITPAKVSPGAYFYGAASFASDIYTVTLTPPLAGLANGVKILVKIPTANTATEASLVVNGLPNAAGAPIRKRLNTKLLAGELMAGSIVEFTYNTSGAVAHWEANTPGLFERSNYALTTGTVASNRCSAYVLALDWEYADVTQWTNRVFIARAHADCNAAPTMKVGATASVKTLKWLDGQAIAQSQIRKGQVFGFVYDLAADAFLLVGEQPSGIFGAVETSGSGTTWVASIPGFPEAPVAGLSVLLKVPANNTGACTLKVTSPISGTTTGDIPVKKHYNRALNQGDVVNNSYLVLTYDGTNWQLLTPTAQPIVMAMVVFDGATVSPAKKAYNVNPTTGITRHSQGRYTIAFETPLPSVNYAVHIQADRDGAGNSRVAIVDDPLTNQLVGSVKIGTFNFVGGGFTDCDRVYVTVIGFPNS